MNRTNQAIHQNGVAIEKLTVASIRENKIIAQLTERAWRDSRSVKNLTFIAMLYLPASLIAVRDPSKEIEYRVFKTFHLDLEV